MKNKLLLQSLCPLFVLVMIQNINLEMFNCEGIFIGVPNVIKNNIISIMCLVLIVLSLIFFVSFGVFKRKGLENPETIEYVQNINEMNLSFFITYIMPLVTMNMTDLKSIFVFIVIMAFMVVLLAKTDLYYANPILSFAGYNIFQIKTSRKSENIVIITKNDISVKDKIYLKPIKGQVYYGKKAGE